MRIEHILRLIVIAIVLVVAFSLLGWILEFGSMLVGIGLRVLILLLMVAVILRLIQALRRS